jgi:sulfhydrogenase subunit beta (sulfur reductase)
LLITSDCFSILEHCHCNSYNIRPWSESHADLSVILVEGIIFLRILSARGQDFAGKIQAIVPPDDDDYIKAIDKAHNNAETKLAEANKRLPGYEVTSKLLSGAQSYIWGKYSSRCVSCGACSSICPTCTCFLLIDKPGFNKVKQLDTCQYPGFERVAGGEDALFELQSRFKNRYMCKYVWKPEKFNSLPCTGCGRCIDACPGKINKNELIMELVKE